MTLSIMGFIPQNNAIQIVTKTSDMFNQFKALFSTNSVSLLTPVDAIEYFTISSNALVTAYNTVGEDIGTTNIAEL